ncbi:MAG TPA: phosphoribosyltransferase [Phycisphaerae bacterium]|nr:phosphoribosyltransferase [Phycisphaerae bacterium]
MMLFEDRVDAGRKLASRLEHLAKAKPLVLALPRGGVVVASEVARALRAPLDVIVTRKLGAPLQPEFGFGAVGPGDVRVIDRQSVRMLGLSDSDVERIATRELAELARREGVYRRGRRAPNVAGKTVILVDDGAATGVTMQAAIRSVRAGGPERLVVALPVAPPDTAETLGADADEIICLATPDQFAAVGQWYRRFDQVDDDEVIDLLRRARRPAPAAAHTR